MDPEQVIQNNRNRYEQYLKRIYWAELKYTIFSPMLIGILNLTYVKYRQRTMSDEEAWKTTYNTYIWGLWTQYVIIFVLSLFRHPHVPVPVIIGYNPRADRRQTTYCQCAKANLLIFWVIVNIYHLLPLQNLHVDTKLGKNLTIALILYMYQTSWLAYVRFVYSTFLHILLENRQ